MITIANHRSDSDLRSNDRVAKVCQCDRELHARRDCCGSGRIGGGGATRNAQCIVIIYGKQEFAPGDVTGRPRVAEFTLYYVG